MPIQPAAASFQLKFAGVAVVAYTGWSARSLLEAWQHSPFDRADLAAWAIWMLPVGCGLFGKSNVRLGWLGAALVLVFAGTLLDLNVLRHFAFALACAGLVAPRRACWIWLPMALAWMPALGWVFSRFDCGLVAAGSLRVLLAAIGTTAYFGSRK